MDFELTDEHKELENTVYKFGEKNIVPFIRTNDKNEKFDDMLFEKMAEAGLLGLCIPEQYGGAGMDYISLGIACEQLERADTSARVVLSVHLGLNCLTLLQWGNRAQKEKYLTLQAQGKKIGAFGLTEPDAGSDVASIKTRAEKKGNSYILNGEKTWISLADKADNYIIFAYTDSSKPKKGISAFIVEKGFPGVSTSPIKGKLGVRAGNTGSISMSNVEVPKENLLGREGEGFKIAMSALDNGRLTVASGACGIIKACLAASVSYANTRKAFGKKIGEHQFVQGMISLMVSGYDIGRLLYFKAAWLKNTGRRNTRETALAKWINTDAAFSAADNALQIHGAYGYSDEFPLERMLRNSRGSIIYEGSREIQKIIQAQYALGYRKDKSIRRMLPSWPYTYS